MSRPSVQKSNNWTYVRKFLRKFGDRYFDIEIRESKSMRACFIRYTGDRFFRMCYKRRKNSRNFDVNRVIAIAISEFHGYHCLLMLD